MEMRQLLPIRLTKDQSVTPENKSFMRLMLLLFYFVRLKMILTSLNLEYVFALWFLDDKLLEKR